MTYDKRQIDIALGIMSGRIDPEKDLRLFDDAQQLHKNLVSAMSGGAGNPGPHYHRKKAEEILLHLIYANIAVCGQAPAAGTGTQDGLVGGKSK